MITDNETLTHVVQGDNDSPIQFYDDGYGPLWLHQNSLGITGIVRARNESDAYEIFEDEFFPEADETPEELIKEYAFKVDYVRLTDDTGAFAGWNRIETFDDNPDTQWETISNNEGFLESFGYRPNGGQLYAKDMNGDWLEILTPERMNELDITCHYSDNN
jgi:hypothetical protein